MRPVLVSQRLIRADGHNEVRDALDVRWASFLAAAGLLALPMPVRSGVREFAAAIDDIAGVILTGGNDLASVCDDPLSAQRDAFEFGLCAAAEEKGWPVLGVCRGLQVLAHRAGMPLERVAGHVATRHEIAVDAGARWLAPHDGRDVNSYHGFAPVTASAADYAVVGRSGDGVIEGIEHRRLPIAGIMWHPEREAVFHTADIALFRDFFGGRP